MARTCGAKHLLRHVHNKGMAHKGALLTRNATHASNRAYDDADFQIRARARRMTFQYDERIQPILQKFRLDYIARLGQMKIDLQLITALAERWRRETHSFHLPTGEITPTLEDVSCLLGLPIDGDPIIGDTDEQWEDEVEAAFKRMDWHTFPRPPGTFHMRLPWLREPWVPPDVDDNRHVPAMLAPNAGPEDIVHYARAFMLDLLGSVMFPDHSGYVCSMFLPLIQNVDDPPKYSWGTAVLAYLYRGLCSASVMSTQELTAPCIFLQIWAWTRFPIGRPQALFFENGLEGRPLGVRWVGEHKYINVPRGSVSEYRRAFEELRDDDVNWRPYKDIMHELPPICREENEMALWFYEGPIIWFWVVESYTPQRVMRQFGMHQIIPPPLLPCSDNLHAIKHKPLSNIDWLKLHKPYLDLWASRAQHIMPIDGPYDSNKAKQYLAWFNREGMRTVFWRASTGREINYPQPVPISGDPLNQRFVVHGERVQQTIIRNLLFAREAAGAIQEFSGPAQAFARWALRVCRSNLDDVNRGDVFQQFLAQHELSEENIDLTQEQSVEVNLADQQWLSTLLSSEYGMFVPEPPIFQPITRQLSQAGVWERGESSGSGVGSS
ncbi:hypothetical protein LUZ63_017576 [Rhynchospora breviuscula]|uniref:Aminotransferase-like plant mobile domain-containing protein n=1 Tax=Rhynchospora breviuscula TaxID=2022672 RepID=A0A9Q0HFU1_9POAL|nr:hypothetical protein LUZ63_017576 [Rhynchospora breviuscula]